jgi:Domain of unknown function (DUF5916)/Carbohydrate family 9 binding domain-like
VIDGRVGEAEWAGAATADDFVQYEPGRGDSSRVHTEALVLYDDGFLYVAFRAFDPEPVIAQRTQRDADLLAEDAVVVVLDTTLDRQTGSYFITNALGTQADGRITEDGRRLDEAWDTAWRSASRRHRRGWSTEIAIPLRSVPYAAGHGREFGLNLGRSRARNHEISFWAGPLDGRLQVSHAGRLVGLDLAAPADRLQLIPYGLGQLEAGRRGEWSAGGDARYALTPRMGVWATLNPDFATIEADQEQVNLTRFELRLPEKRPFFLEGNELFSQRIRTFYSRRVSDVALGAKLNGQAGPWKIALLAADGGAGGDRPLYTVARVQRDLGRSFVALMAANRRLGGRDEGSVGVDASLLLTARLGVTAQVVRSYGRFGRGAGGVLIRPAYDSPTTHAHLRYTDLGERFADNANAMGLVLDDDRREIDAGFHTTRWLRSGSVERLYVLGSVNAYWGHDGRLRGWDSLHLVDVFLRSRLGLHASYTENLRRFEDDFRNRDVGLEVGFDEQDYSSVTAGVHLGRSFGSDFRLFSGRARVKLTPRLSAEYELERLSLEPDPGDASTWIHVFRASEFFTPDLFLKVFFQTNSAIDRRNLQVAFVYRYRPPFGLVQLAYQRGTAGLGDRSEQGSTLLLKLTTVF